MKKLRYIIFLSILLLSYTHLQAADKQYTINKADINVNLLENGDAEIQEIWHLDFIEGNFTRFYVEHYWNLTPLEAHSHITSITASTNGTPCSFTEDTSSRIPGTFSNISTDDSYTYTWYFNAENQEMIFQVNYTLQNIVKYTDNSEALFCYRFIGENFTKEINQLCIDIHSPTPCDIQVRTGTQYNPSLNSGVAHFNISNSEGLVKICVAMPKEIFSDTLSYISPGEVNQSTSSGKPITIPFLFPFIAFLMIYAYTSYKKHYQHNYGNAYISKKLLRAASNTARIKEIYNSFERLHITPAEYSFLVHQPFSGMHIFRLIYLDLFRKNIITVEDSNLVINTESTLLLKSYEKEVIQLLLKYMSISDSSGKYMNASSVPLKTFRDMFINYYTEISTAAENLKKEIIVPKNDKELNQDAKLLQAYFHLNKSLYPDNSDEIFQCYKSNHTISLSGLYFLAAFGRKRTSEQIYPCEYEANRIEDINEDGFYSEIAFILDSSSSICTTPYYISLSGESNRDRNSSSGCGGCGGCGGGGAD